MIARSLLLAALLTTSASILTARENLWEMCRETLDLAASAGSFATNVETALEGCNALFVSQLSAEAGAEAGANCLADLYRRAAHGSPLQSAARAEMELRAQQSPEEPWLRLRLSRIHWGDDLATGRDFEEAVQLFERSGDRRGEVIARLARAYWLLQRPPSGEGSAAPIPRAKADIARATQINAQLGDRNLAATVKSRRAFVLLKSHSNLRRAYYLLREAEASFLPNEDTYVERRICLRLLADVASRLGNSAEVHQFASQGLRLACEGQFVFDIAAAALGLTAAETELTSGSTWRERVEEGAQLTLRAARVSQSMEVRINALRLLGDLALGNADRVAGERYLESSFSLAMSRRETGWGGWGPSQASYAYFLADSDPERATQLMDEAMQWMAISGDWSTYLLNSAAYFEVAEKTGTRAETDQRSRRMLDLVDSLADLQLSPSAQAQVISAWVSVYTRRAGWLLGAGTGATEIKAGPAPSLEVMSEVFFVMERKRNRALMERLRAPATEPVDEELARKLDALLERRVDANRRLLSLSGDTATQEELSGQLNLLENERQKLILQIAEKSGDLVPLRPDQLASLAEVQRKLETNEAMLYYQIASRVDLAGRFVGDSWLQVVTAEEVRVHPLNSADLYSTGFGHSIAWRPSDGLGNPALAYHASLAQALARLPTHIDHLIVLGDGALHGLSFGLLQESAESEPLVENYSISYAPSATLWAELRSQTPVQRSVPMIALGDPSTLNQEFFGRIAFERGWGRAQDLRPLRYARKEVQRARRWIGEGSVALVRGKASEATLKLRMDKPATVYHFAAHAIVDDLYPSLSAILLAPGDSREDGLLHPDEIAQFDLKGALVVLSTCQSANGKQLLNEGPESLAREFLLAGARAVVATLRNVDDRRTLHLIDAFYRHLAGGTSVATALANAQRERNNAGEPASDWGAFVVLGDGGYVPFPNGRPSQHPLLRRTAGAAIALLLIVAASAALRRRSRPHPA